MATKKVSALTELTSPDGSEELLVNDGGTSKKVTIDNLLYDEAIDSDHYVDGSIDNAHLADDAVDSDELAAGAVDIAHLSATGTAGSSNFLRGDNSWVTPTDTNTTYSTATSSAEGLVKIEDDTDQSVAANTVSTTAGRTYGIQLNSSDQAVVNVPWTDTDTNTNQLTTFTVSATTDSNATTISQGDDLMFTAGTGITCETTADGTVTITNTVSDTNTMGSGFTVSATTDSNATTITQGDDLMFTAGTGITCETTADGTVTITNTVSDTNTTYSVQDGELSEINFTSADHTKLNAIEASADVTDATNVGTVVNGKQTIWVPANSMTPTASNPCADITAVETTADRPDMYVLDFDASSDEHAQFTVAFPKSWNLGTVTYQAFWTSTATDTDGVTWGLQGVAVSNDGTIDVAYGTAITVDDDNISAAEDLLVTAESTAVTIAGTPADDDVCFFRVFRDISAANDDMTEDARLLGVKLFYTTDALNDA